jgi:integrase
VFLQWSAKTRLTRRFALPTPHSPGTAPMPERDRTALLGKVLTSDDAPLRSRAAAAILLLYAQPLSRITRLTIDDIVHDGDQVLLRLGNPPSPVPEPVAALLLEYLGQRTNISTATNRASRWLFPGRCAGQPLRADTLSALLVHDLGVPATAGRAAAIRQHVRDLPAPIVATALGYHHNTTTRHTAEAGTIWAGYAANGRQSRKP